LRFWNGKLRGATIHADQEIGKNPDDGLVKTFQSGEMDGYFRVKLVSVV
jgi:hypothetical protein